MLLKFPVFFFFPKSKFIKKLVYIVQICLKKHADLCPWMATSESTQQVATSQNFSAIVWRGKIVGVLVLNNGFLLYLLFLKIKKKRKKSFI